jgi:hypothetical protein
MRHSLMLLIVATLMGCANHHQVRYVYQDRDFGVIGMPENTDFWPTHYRRQGAKLMAAHFQEGYEIVRAEEVIEGDRTLKVEGSGSAEISPEISAPHFKVVKLGHAATRSQADTVKIKECRIIYRRAGLKTAPTSSPAATLTPTWYLDPNAAERRKAAEAPQDKPKHRDTRQESGKARPPIAKSGDQRGSDAKLP